MPCQRRCFLAGGTFHSRRPLLVSVDGCLTSWSLPHQQHCFLIGGYFRSRRPLSVSGRWFDQLVVVGSGGYCPINGIAFSSGVTSVLVDYFGPFGWLFDRLVISVIAPSTLLLLLLSLVSRPLAIMSFPREMGDGIHRINNSLYVALTVVE